MTLGLEGRCSIQLSYGQKFLPADKPKFWSGWRDSNSRHPAPKAGALPNCAIARYAIKAQEIIINDAGYIACRAYEFKKVLDSLDSI